MTSVHVDWTSWRCLRCGYTAERETDAYVAVVEHMKSHQQSDVSEAERASMKDVPAGDSRQNLSPESVVGVSAARRRQEEIGPFFVCDMARLIGLPDDASMDTVAEFYESIFKHLRTVLCNVSQIFNGWRSDEAWTGWDEEVAQAVIVMQRKLEPDPPCVVPPLQEGTRAR